MRMHLKFVAPILIAGALVLTSCGSSDSNAAAPTTTTAARAATSTEQSADTFNDADVAFLQGMYPHHAQAVEMTDMVPGRTTNPDVLALAVQIEAAQQPEMDQMAALLKTWGQSAPSARMAEMGHGGMDHSGMDGMMTADQMAELGGLSGPDFDRMWMTMMIEHHEGAVTMSQAVIADGISPEVRTMADAIIAAQQAEIATMQNLIAAQ